MIESLYVREAVYERLCLCVCVKIGVYKSTRERKDEQMR